ncbi:MAG: hypothetical protein RLZZ41_245 [Actinomycetota bacterium]
MMIELGNDLNKDAQPKCCSRNDAPVVSSDDRSGADTRSRLTFLESFQLLANNKSYGTRVGVQDVAGANHPLGSSTIIPSPFEIGFISTGDGVSSGSNSYGYGEVANLGFQNQAASSFDVLHVTDADLNPAKWIIDGNQVFSYFYAGLDKKDKNHPGNKQVQRKRSQEGSRTVDEVVESSYQSVDDKHRSTADQSGKRSVLEILHDSSLTEEEVG